MWDENKAATLQGDEVALIIYRSNILGADLRFTSFGGGNTSYKSFGKYPLTGKQKEVMWIKGSGGDPGKPIRKGVAGFYVDRLLVLKIVCRGINYEDEILTLLYQKCIN